MPESGSGEAGPGIVQSLRNLAATLIEILRTRFELLVTELEEERVRLLQLLVWAAGALFLFGVGILLLVIMVVGMFWDSPYRVTAIVVLAGIFFAGSIGLGIAVHNRIHERPRLFSASLDELAKDRDQLTQR